MREFLFSTLPYWQLYLWVIVISAIVGAVAHAVFSAQTRQKVYAEVCNHVAALGLEMRRGGYLARAALVEAASEAVKALGTPRYLPPFLRRGPVPEKPIDRFIRQMRCKAKVVRAKLLPPPPDPHPHVGKRVTIVPRATSGR